MVDFAFLDSGTGGIPYLTYLLEKRPDASCVYVGDTVNFPYGEKSHEQIVKCVLSITDKIIKTFEPRVVVVACNTMSVNTIDILREIYPDTLFVGTVPAIKLAASVSKKRRIGLMATRATVEHPYNVDLKNHFASDCELVLRPDPELIAFIEHESFTATKEECIKAVEPCVNFFKEKDCDAMILGCTHFLNLRDLIQEVAGDKLKVIDSREGVVNRALNILDSLKNKTVSEKRKPFLYVTMLSDEEKVEYDVICSRYNLEWGGVLK